MNVKIRSLREDVHTLNITTYKRPCYFLMFMSLCLQVCLNNALPQTPITMPRFGKNRMNLHGTAHYSVDTERSIASNYRKFTARNTGHSNYSISCTSCTLQVYIGNHDQVFSLLLIEKKKLAARIWIACLCLISWSQFIEVLSTALRCRVAANS